MNEEYEVIHIVGEGRTIKNNKTGKIYYNEFQIIEEKNKELDQYKNNWKELKKWLEEEIIINKTNQIEDPNYPEWYIKWNCYLNLLNKMKELEEGK